MDVKLQNILKNEYLIEIKKIEKNEESTVGNVYIVYTQFEKYILKIYDELNHVKSITLLHNDLSNEFNIPKIIKSKNKEDYIEILDSKYIVLYSFLEGIQIGKEFSNIPDEIVKKVALDLRSMHEKTLGFNKYNLNNITFFKNDNIKRYSLLHFDLTKHNIFYNEKLDKIGFIDFDDAKYGPSVCDVAILVSLLFFSKKRGVDKENLNLFIDTYYGNDIELKLLEEKYIKEIALKWIDYILNVNTFDTSLKESFEVKRKLIKEEIL